MTILEELCSSPLFFWYQVYRIRHDRETWMFIHDHEAWAQSWEEARWTPWGVIEQEFGKEDLPLWDARLALKLVSSGKILCAISPFCDPVKWEKGKNRPLVDPDDNIKTIALQLKAYQIRKEAEQLQGIERIKKEYMSCIMENKDAFECQIKYAERYIKNQNSRICGLWLYDNINIFRRYKKIQDAVTELQSLKYNGRKIVDCLGFGSSEYRVYNRFYKKTVECIEQVRILPFN